MVISLIRAHSEIIRPPRTLFVPFELGRPIGNPNDEKRQKNVLVTALELLQQNGPVPVLADYPEFTSYRLERNLQLPFELPDSSGSVDANALLREFEVVHPAYTQAKVDNRRTTFGNSNFSAEKLISIIGRLLEGTADTDARLSSDVIRFLVDDLKTLYLEAACLGQKNLTSTQLNNWFWCHTMAARAIIKLRSEFLASEDKNRRLISSVMVPGEWLSKLGL